MRIKNKLIFFLGALILTLTVNFSVFAAQGTTNDTDDVKNTINNYFSTFYKSLEILETPNYTGIVESNKDTELYIAQNELHIEQYKLINLSYENTAFNLDFKNLKVKDSSAEVTLLMNCTYNYSTTPDVVSSMSKVKYKFGLIKEGSKWVINYIDSDSDEFSDFKDAVAKKAINTTPDVVVKKTKQDLINKAKDTVKYLGGSPTADKTHKIVNPQTISLSGYTSHPYNTSSGVAYALSYAESPNPNFYYYENADCTNFVSQCLRAAYGGTNSGISSKSAMTSTWYGGSGGGSTSWESVPGLWKQVVTSYPGNGPNGTGYNNNSPYYNFAPGRIYLGEVLQFKNISSSTLVEYSHSVYVTSSKNSSNKYYNEILVSQHSSLWKNRNLYDLILGKGGNSCYMRDIAFTSAYLY